LSGYSGQGFSLKAEKNRLALPAAFRKAVTDSSGNERVLCLGLSSGINVAGAVALGKQLGKGSRVATILCDTGFRYLSTLYNADWLEAKGLPVFDWLR
jgi:hypothetical protein